MSDTATLEHALGHSFADPGLLEEALRHRSVMAVRKGHRNSNERLEFVGDRVLGLIVAEWLAERFPRDKEGDLGKRLAALVSRDAVVRVAEAISLGTYLILLEEEARAGVGEKVNVLADAMEAVLGALYLDGGLEPARAFVRRSWAAMLDQMTAPPISPKSRLQEWSLGRGLGLPGYRLISMTGPAHRPVFSVAVTLGEQEAIAQGDSKQAAETEAATVLYARLTSS